MTTSEILTLARLKLLEAGADLITDSTLLIYANLSHKDIIKRAFPNNSIKSATITFTYGASVLPADFGTLYTDPVDVNDNFYPEVAIANFIRLNDEYGVTIEAAEIKVSPATTTSVDIKYYPTYATLTASVNPTIDEYLHEPIVYGTLARSFEDLQDPEMSQFYANKYETMLKSRLDNLSNYEEDAQKGNTMFNGISII
jgi:hypothetical protein